MPTGGALFKDPQGNEVWLWDSEFQTAATRGLTLVSPDQSVPTYSDTGPAGTETVESIIERGRRGTVRGVGGIGEQAGIAEERGIQEEYEDKGELAFLAGVGRGVSFGGSDVLLEFLGVEEKTLRDLKRVNPYASLGGELGGVLATSMLPFGQGRLAQVARMTPAGAVSAKAAQLGAGSGKAYIAAQTVEGSLYGIGHAISEISLGNTELAGESVFGELGKGALWGGFGGAAVSGGLVAGKKIWGRLSGGASNITPVQQLMDDVGLQRVMGDNVKSIHEGLEVLGRKLNGDISLNPEEIEGLVILGRKLDELDDTIIRGLQQELKSLDDVGLEKLTTADRLPSVKQAESWLRGEGDVLLGLAAMQNPALYALMKPKMLKKIRSIRDLMKQTDVDPNVIERTFNEYIDDLTRLGDDLGIDVQAKIMKNIPEGVDSWTAAAQLVGKADLNKGQLEELLSLRKAYHKAGKLDESWIKSIAKGTDEQAFSRVEHVQRYLTKLKEMAPEMNLQTKFLDELADGSFLGSAAWRSRLVGEPMGGFDDVVEAQKFLKTNFGDFSGSKVKQFFSKDADELMHLHAEMTEKLGRAAEHAKNHGVSELLEATQKAADDFAEQVLKQLPDGAEALSGVGLGELAAMAGVGYLPNIDGPYDDIFKAAIIARLVGGKGGHRGKSLLNKLFTASLARGGAQAAGSAVFGVSKAGGASNFLANFLSGGARAPVYSVVQAAGSRAARGAEAAQATGRVKSRIARAVEMMHSGAHRTAKSFSKAGFASLATLNAVKFGGGPDKKFDTVQEAYVQRVKELEQLTSNPPALALAIHDLVAPWRETNMDLGDKMAGGAVKRLMLLREQLPIDPGVMHRLGQTRFVGDSLSQRSFARALNIFINPMELIERLPNGVITHAEAKFWKAAWPAKFQEFKQQFIKKLPDIQKTSTYDQRIRWSVFFEMPVDSVMRSEFVSFIQDQFVERAAQQSAPPASASGSSPKEPRTRSQQLDSRRQGL
jgi:hypothetical protein